MKSRLYYLDRKEGPVDNMWFFMPEKQSSKRDYTYRRFWLFLAALPAKPIRDVTTLDENYIIHRDIFFAPWKIYTFFKLGEHAAKNKYGPGRNVSIKFLKNNIPFNIKYLEKSKIFFPKGENLESLLKV